MAFELAGHYGNDPGSSEEAGGAHNTRTSDRFRFDFGNYASISVAVRLAFPYTARRSPTDGQYPWVGVTHRQFTERIVKPRKIPRQPIVYSWQARPPFASYNSAHVRSAPTGVSEHGGAFSQRPPHRSSNLLFRRGSTARFRQWSFLSHDYPRFALRR